MAYFKSSEALQDVLENFFKSLTAHPQIGPKLLESNLIIKFIYKEPDLSLVIDCSGDAVNIIANDNTLTPTVEMSMKADTAHRFWFGKVNLVAALTRREIVAKGSIPKILKLLPVIKPSYELYPKFLVEKGYNDLVL